MMPMSTTPHNINKQSGVSIVTAIFLVMVLSLMGIGMVSLLTTSQQSISQEISSAKAYMAARSCLQWGMYQAAYPAITGTYTNTFSSTGLFNTTCTTSLSNINNDGLIFYNISALAKYGDTNTPEYSQRELRLQFQP